MGRQRVTANDTDYLGNNVVKKLKASVFHNTREAISANTSSRDCSPFFSAVSAKAV